MTGIDRRPFTVRALLTILTLGSSAVSFLAYTLLLRYLGASKDLDLIFFAASWPLAIAGLVGGVLLYLFPPQLVRMSPHRQLAVARAFAAFFLTIATVAGGGILIFAGMRGELMFGALLMGYVLAGGFSLATALPLGVAQARGAYLVTGFGGAIVPAVGVLCGACMAIAAHQPVWLLAGQFGGSVLGFVVSGRAVELHAGMSLRRDLMVGVAAAAALRTRAIQVLLGTAAFTLFQPIDAHLCASLGEGALAVMAYCLRVLVAVSTAASFGAFAIAAKTSHDTLKSAGMDALVAQSRSESTRIVVAGLAAWAAYFAVGKYAVTVLFHSTEMDAVDVARLSDCLLWMLLGAGPMAAIPYLFRVLYSAGDYVRPACIGTVVPLAYATTALALMDKMGIVGLAIASALVWWSAFAVCIYCVNRSKSSDGAVKVW